MRVSISTLKMGDKFLFPNLVDGASLNNEPCVIIGDLSNQADYVVLKTGQRGSLPLKTEVSKIEGFRMFYNKRLT